jgi:hypothetical protein
MPLDVAETQAGTPFSGNVTAVDLFAERVNAFLISEVRPTIARYRQQEATVLGVLQLLQDRSRLGDHASTRARAWLCERLTVIKDDLNFPVDRRPAEKLLDAVSIGDVEAKL